MAMGRLATRPKGVLGVLWSVGVLGRGMWAGLMSKRDWGDVVRWGGSGKWMVGHSGVMV